jgi:hypothetical protein
VDIASVLAMLEEAGSEADVRPALALLAGRGLELGSDEVDPALRRAILLLAAGGDPHRGLELDGRAVTALAAELDRPERRALIVRELEVLRSESGLWPGVAAALAELVADDGLAWRGYACALLADELGE